MNEGVKEFFSATDGVRCCSSNVMAGVMQVATFASGSSLPVDASESSAQTHSTRSTAVCEAGKSIGRQLWSFEYFHYTSGPLFLTSDLLCFLPVFPSP